MQIVPLREIHLPALHDVYVRLTRDVPHCRFQPSLAHFSDSLLHPSKGHTQILVAEDGVRRDTAALGFAALLPPDRPPAGALPASSPALPAAAPAPAPEPARPPEAHLTALFAEDQAALDLLLEHATATARSLGAHRLLAFPQEHERCPIRSYMAGWCGLSDRLPTIARALATAGFAPFYRELHLTAAGARFPPPVTPAPPDVELRPGQDKYQRPVLRAMLGEEQIGVCAYSRLGGQSDHPAAESCGFIWWLHTEKAHRRRGIARALLSRVLADLHQAGCTECWITTGADNWPAQPLYLALGFEIVDSSACFVRDLSPAAELTTHGGRM